MSDGADASGRDPETLQLYVEESLEGLQQIDRILLEAERGSPAPNTMATLFRAVHTIKGTAGYLAFERTQSLAHTAEDLLSRLRDGKIVARPEHFTALLAVGERLRQMVENVRASGEEGDVEVASLVAELRASMAVEVGAGPGATTATPAATAAANTAAPTTPAGPTSVVPTAASLSAETNVTADTAPTAAQATSTSVSAPAAATGAATSPAVAQGPAGVTAGAAGAGSSGVSPRPEVEAKVKAEAKGDAKGDAKGEAARVDPADGTVRVNVAVLDRLMNLIGELVLARNQIIQLNSGAQEARLSGQAAFQRLNVVTGELQEQVMKTRMQPVSRVFEKIPRMVRDVARVVGKKVDCVIEGNNTEIDKALVEAIRDPVMHIVRNALDHGIESPDERVRKSKPESGTLHVRAAHKGGAVTIEIEDDGKGMDPAGLRVHAVRKGVITPAEAERLGDRESLELVFRPGFSTAAVVTDISGRGVGMDVVRTHVRQAGGEAEIESIVHRGTTIRLKMPLTLAIIPALLIRAGGQRFAIPQVNLLELVYLSEERTAVDIDNVRGADVHRLRGEILPVVNLREALSLPPLTQEEAARGTYCVVLASGARRYSMVVDAIENTEEIVIKPLRGQLKRLTCYSGATVLGDGDVALILDAAGIATKAGIDLQARREGEAATLAKTERRSESMMVFRAAGGIQCAVPLSMVARLEQVAAGSIEDVGGREVLQYRGELLSVVRPEQLLAPRSVGPSGTEQLLLVFDFGRPVGMCVEEVLDVADVDLSAASLQSDVAYAHGKVVLYGHTTLLLDIYHMVQQLLPSFFQQTLREARRGRVLVAEPTAGLRSSLASYLQTQGLEVTCVPNAEGVSSELRGKLGASYDALVADEALLLQQNAALLKSLAGGETSLPVLAWSGESGHAGALEEAGGVHGVYPKQAREQLMAALKELGERRHEPVERSTP